jgi:hypothetical protein
MAERPLLPSYPRSTSEAKRSGGRCILVVDVGGAELAGKSAKDRTLPDVDDCLVAVGDLRVEGCDIRSVRIAVAILPRDCSPYEIECGCCCC